MNPEPKAVIGQNVNTERFGVSVVRDVYFSTESKTFVYEISPLINLNQHFLEFEEDLL